MSVACIWFSQSAPTSKLAELFLRFSPQICLRTDRAIFVEIGKCRKLYSEDSFKARAQVLLRKSGYSARVRIAPDILQSLVLNMYEASTLGELPLESLVEFADPFDRDPVLRKSVQNLVQSFQDLGVKTLAQFRKLKVEELIARFGIVGRFCYIRFTETGSLVWPHWQPEEVIQEKKEFPYFEFYGELDPILFELKAQLDSIFARLFARRKRLAKLQVQICCEKVSTNPEPIRKFDFDFFTPQSDSKSTLRILKERLTREFERRPVLSPIESIHSIALKATHHESSQKNIFNNDEEKFEQIHSVHNQLIELLGRENIFQAELTEDRRPERSWVKKYDSPHEAQLATPEVMTYIPERSTYLCRKPIPIKVTASFVQINKKRFRILNWDNQVEKISGGWFEKPVPETANTFDRSYYNVELEGHHRISVFETPEREFYLHGYYG